MILNEIAGASLNDLAEVHGTPFFVYDQSVLEDRIRELKQFFPVVRYAQKANPHLAFLDLMRKSGVVVDAVSAGEIERALAAGYAPDQIAYTADVFTDEVLRLVANLPIRVNCGSPTMLSQFAEARPGGDVMLRLNPGFGHGHSKKTDTGGPASKHGIWHDQLYDCLRIAMELGLQVTGLHMHIGSGSDFEHLAKVGDAMVELCAEGGDIRVISAGGGLPTPYRDGEDRIDLERYWQVWDSHRRTIERQLGHAVELEIEPGRYLVAEAGWLVCRLWAIKETPTFRFYLVDAGFNNLARPAMYGAYHKISVCTHDGREPGSVEDVVVAGPLCESGDVFTQEEGGVVVTQPLPAAEVGDLVVIHCAGAYGRAMSSNYNSHPFPAEILLVDGQPHQITARQSLQDLWALETIPS